MSKALKGIVGDANKARTEMKQALVERGAVIDLLWMVTLARTHAVLLGDPGTGKSLLIRELLSHISDARKFEILLNKTTPPEALVGPISLKALENDEFTRITKGKLPEAHIAFVDEIYKSNATNLNLLLPILNERLFFNNGTPSMLELWSVIGASNELPTHDRQDLIAFTDRMPLRYVVQPVRTTDGLSQILEGQLTRLAGDKVADTHTVIAKDDFEAMQEAVTKVSVPNRVKQKWAELQIKAADEGLVVSTRRMFDGLKLCMANAVLNDRSEVKIEDLRVFEHVLWDDPEDIPLAGNLTMDFAGEVGRAAARLRQEYEEFAAKLTEAQGKFPADNSPVPEEATSAMTNVSSNLRRLDARIDEAIEDAERDGYDASELESIKSDVTRARTTVREALGAV